MKPRKLLGLLLALSLAVSVIPTAAYAAGSDPWDGTAIDTSWYDPALSAFTVSDAADLAGLATLVNDETDFSGKTVTLTTDIDLNAKSWTPIGGSSSSFAGTFDGGHHTISNLNIDGAGTAWYLGLFGKTGAGSIVKNLVIDSCQIINGAYSVGAVVGVTEGTVAGCSVSGSISGDENVGGIAGLAACGTGVATVSDCSTAGLTVEGRYKVGGIVGLVSYGLISGCTAAGTVTDGARANSSDIGGIAGRAAYATTFRSCSATNTVSGDSYVGGIVGSTNGGGNSTCIVRECESLGIVSATAQFVGGIAGSTYNTDVAVCHSAGTVNSSLPAPQFAWAGGLLGQAGAGTVVAGSSATGTVSALAYGVGGVAGGLDGMVRDCYAGGSVTAKGLVGGVVGSVNAGATLETSYSSTGVTAGTAGMSGRVAGGVAGTGTVRYCYFTVIPGDTFLGVGSSTGTVSDVSSKTPDEFSSGEVAWLLNTLNGTTSNRDVWTTDAAAPAFADALGQAATYRIVLTNAATPHGAAYGTFYSDATGAVALPLPAVIDPAHYFFGWYADANYLTSRSAPATLTSDLTLFGNFGERIVSLSDYRTRFTGNAVVYAGTVTDNASGISSEGLTLTYYTDAGGTIKTNAANDGASSDGGAPVRPGRYYVRATAAADAVKSINAAASNYAVMTIVKPIYHSIEAIQSEGGAVTLSSQFVESHDGVMFAITPDAGYRIADVLVNGVSVGAVDHYTVSDVVKNMTVQAVFRKIWQNPYADVPSDALYLDALAFVSEHGLFRGVDSNLFDPDGTMTRGMAVTVLLRLSGGDAGGPVAGFSDVPSDSWYASAVAWANANGVASGVGGSRFAPDAAVTREQLAVMLFNYAKYVGTDVSVPDGAKIDSFSDYGAVSSWADEAMAWAVANGFISGDGSSLHPGSAVTRAEVAVILQRFAGHH